MCSCFVSFCLLYLLATFTSSSELVLRLRGAGRFPLMRKVRHAFETMHKEERLRLLDATHRAAPIFDYGNDRFTRELHKARIRWAKEELRNQRRANITKTRAMELEKQAERVSKPVPPRFASLPDVARMPRIADRVAALRPFAQGQRGAVRPADAIAAMAHLHFSGGDEGGLLPRRLRTR